MRFTSRAGIWLLAALLSVLIVCCTLCFADQGSSRGLLKLTILYMNDPHGHYVPYSKLGSSDLIGGFGRASTVMSQVEEQNRQHGRQTLKLLAGDLLMGTPFSTAFRGELGVKLMNTMQFDAMVVGNHDFDYGQDNLMSNVKANANFALISANIKTKTGERIFGSALEKDIADPKSRITILGLTTPDTPVITFPNNVKDLIFEDPIVAAKEFLRDIDGKELVIALTHLGLEHDKLLARACPRIDIIIGGHSHSALFKPEKVSDTIICQAGAYAEYVGKLDVDVQDGRVVKYSGELIPLGPEVKEDQKITSIIGQYSKKMDSGLSDVIGKTEVVLEGGRSKVTSDSGTNLGRLVAYTMAVNSHADAAIVNGGSIRSSMKKGEIVLGDVYTALPFMNSLVKVDLTGADVAELLERSAALPDGSGGKLQTFGIEYGHDDSKRTIKKIGGRDFDLRQIYSVATSNFLAAGGDGYMIFKEKGRNIDDSSLLVSDLVVNYIKEKKEITQSLLDNLDR